MSTCRKGGCDSLNEHGVTLLETILSIAILLLLAITLLPFANHLQGQLFDKKLAYRASEVAYNGIKEVILTGITQGSRMVEGIEYQWYYNDGEICVQYTDLKGPQSTCITSDDKNQALH